MDSHHLDGADLLLLADREPRLRISVINVLAWNFHKQATLCTAPATSKTMAAFLESNRSLCRDAAAKIVHFYRRQANPLIGGAQVEAATDDLGTLLYRTMVEAGLNGQIENHRYSNRAGPVGSLIDSRQNILDRLAAFGIEIDVNPDTTSLYAVFVNTEEPKARELVEITDEPLEAVIGGLEIAAAHDCLAEILSPGLKPLLDQHKIALSPYREKDDIRILFYCQDDLDIGERWTLRRQDGDIIGEAAIDGIIERLEQGRAQARLPAPGT